MFNSEFKNTGRPQQGFAQGDNPDKSKVELPPFVEKKPGLPDNVISINSKREKKRTDGSEQEVNLKGLALNILFTLQKLDPQYLQANKDVSDLLNHIYSSETIVGAISGISQDSRLSYALVKLELRMKIIANDLGNESVYIKSPQAAGQKLDNIEKLLQIIPRNAKTNFNLNLPF